MTTEIFAENLRPAKALEALVARHGVLAVLLALVPVMIRHKRPARLGPLMSPHLARDIGLHHEPPPKTHWQLR